MEGPFSSRLGACQRPEGILSRQTGSGKFSVWTVRDGQAVAMRLEVDPERGMLDVDLK
jgi:hypothetical protein